MTCSRTTLLLPAMVLLAACGNDYQAPVSEQGEQQVVTAPIIVDSSTPESSFNAPRGSAAVVTSSAAPTRATLDSSVSSSSSSNPGKHRVRGGDTLFSIAFQYDLDFRSLAIANGLNPPYTIFVDQEINLDLSRIQDAQVSRATSNIGTPVADSSVARASAGVSGLGGVIRRSIGGSQSSDPDWQWPHSGSILRSFQAAGSKGIDIAGNVGDPVLAAGNGDVVYSGRGVQGSGNLIIIRHSDRFLSAYAHNSAMLVGEGRRVQAGEKIAEVGENDAGVAMLHFEIRVEGKSVDPARHLPNR